MTANQKRQTGPKKRATLAVPDAWTRNRAIRMPSVMPMTMAGVTCGASDGTERRPSMAESTEMAGVIAASP